MVCIDSNWPRPSSLSMCSIGLFQWCSEDCRPSIQKLGQCYKFLKSVTVLLACLYEATVLIWIRLIYVNYILLNCSSLATPLSKPVYGKLIWEHTQISLRGAIDRFLLPFSAFLLLFLFLFSFSAFTFR